MTFLQEEVEAEIVVQRASKPSSFLLTTAIIPGRHLSYCGEIAESSMRALFLRYYREFLARIHSM